MPNVKYPDPVFENPVKNFIRITSERHDAHARPLRNRRRGFGMSSDMCNDGLDSRFDGSSYGGAKGAAVGGSASL